MITLIALTFLDLFVTVFNILLIVRVVMSYVAKPGNRFLLGLINLTEPVLAPVRSILPNFGPLDIAPLVVFFGLQGIQYLVHMLVGA